jgi:hypothetical protein
MTNEICYDARSHERTILYLCNGKGWQGVSLRIFHHSIPGRDE